MHMLLCTHTKRKKLEIKSKEQVEENRHKYNELTKLVLQKYSLKLQCKVKDMQHNLTLRNTNSINFRKQGNINIKNDVRKRYKARSLPRDKHFQLRIT